MKASRSAISLSLIFIRSSSGTVWVTPKARPKRFLTWFFAASIDDAEVDVQIDGEEIVDFRWITAADALIAQEQKEIALTGPSFVTMSQLANRKTLEESIGYLNRRPVWQYEPKLVKLENGFISLYHEDQSYSVDEWVPQGLSEGDIARSTESALNINAKLPLHRLYMYFDQPWNYLTSNLLDPS